MTVAEFHLAMNCGNAVVGVAEQSGCVRKCCGPGGQLTWRIIHIIIFLADLITHTFEFRESLHPHWEVSAPHVTWCAGVVLSWLLLALEGGILIYFIYLYKSMQSGIVYDYYVLRRLSRIQQSVKFIEEWLLAASYMHIYIKDIKTMQAIANKISVCVSLFSCGFRCLVIFIQACFYGRSNRNCWCNLRKCTVAPLCWKGGCCGCCGCCSIPGGIHWHLTLFSSVSLVMVVSKFLAIFFDVFFKYELPHVAYVSTGNTVRTDQYLENVSLIYFYLVTICLALLAATVQCFFWKLCASCTFKKPPVGVEIASLHHMILYPPQGENTQNVGQIVVMQKLE